MHSSGSTCSLSCVSPIRDFGCTSSLMLSPGRCWLFAWLIMALTVCCRHDHNSCIVNPLPNYFWVIGFFNFSLWVAQFYSLSFNCCTPHSCYVYVDRCTCLHLGHCPVVAGWLIPYWRVTISDVTAIPGICSFILRGCTGLQDDVGCFHGALSTVCPLCNLACEIPFILFPSVTLSLPNSFSLCTAQCFSPFFWSPAFLWSVIGICWILQFNVFDQFYLFSLGAVLCSSSLLASSLIGKSSWCLSFSSGGSLAASRHLAFLPVYIICSRYEPPELHWSVILEAWWNMFIYNHVNDIKNYQKSSILLKQSG